MVYEPSEANAAFRAKRETRVGGETKGAKQESANRQRSEASLPWVLQVFLAGGENFRCWPKADTFSAVGQGNERKSAAHGYRSFRCKFTHSSCKLIVPRT